MGNCCGNGTLPHGRIRRQESSALRESRRIKHKQQNFVRTLLEKDEAKVDLASPPPVFTQSVRRKAAKLRTDKVDFTQYSYPFENLVFEGGGVKALAYSGAVRVLENLGLWSQIKRFAGSSSGAITAALLAVGYNSHDIEDFLSQDLSKIFLDHSCGYCSVLPNLIRGYGWNPGKRIYRWFGKVLSLKTGKADITFSEVFERYGKELCIIATNLNMMNAEYFHRKTTPDVPVRDALRMTMGIPGLFQAVEYEMNGQINTYIDGGVLCNYPIHCYDGWWLSMAMEDSFITKLENVEDFPTLFEKKERFGKYNDKTLGFLLYTDNERDVFQNKLEQRVGTLPQYPETSLASEARGKKNRQEKAKHYHERNLTAVSAFLKVLKKHKINKDDKIDKTELENALKDEEDFPRRYRERLFGKDVTVEEAMLALDKNNDGEIQYNELVQFVAHTGVCLQTQFLGYSRQEIKGLFSFFNTLQSALLTNMKRIFVEERDIDRTVGINTGHVGTSDFKLEPADRKYVVQVAVDECVTSLQDIRDGVNPLGMPRFLSLLEKDLVNGVFKGHHHISRLKHPNQFQKAMRDFIDAIIQNVQNRFPDKELLTALSVLALRPISFLSEAELAEWGNDSIDQLGDFYGQPREHTYKNPATKVTETYRSEPVISATDVKAEWLNLNQVVKVQQYPRSSMASLWQLIAEYHKEDYPNLITLASLALTHPVHTADCERAFSSQNKVTTPARNRLSSDKCDQLMRVMIEGPASDEEPERLNTFFIRALTEWRTIKDRLIFCASKNQNKSQ